MGILKKLALPLLAGTMAFTGCDTTEAPSGSSRLSIMLTDAPGDFKAAVVTITDIYLQPGEGDDAQRVYLLEKGNVTTDLLTLANDAMTLVDSKVVPAGSYEQLRFVITGGYIEVVEEEDAEGNPTRTKIFASSPSYAGLPAGATVSGSLQMPATPRAA